MNVSNSLIKLIVDNFENKEIYPTLIYSVLIMVTILAIYEYIIYRYILRRTIFNKSFGLSMVLIPYFIASIILCLQSNLVITLGTIGALAIIRFRTAIKDPIDIVFVFWSIFIGIMCGCQLYELGFATSLIATLVIFVMTRLAVGNKTHILVVNLSKIDAQGEVEEIIKKHTKRYRVKSRNFNGDGVNLIIEMISIKPDVIVSDISRVKSIRKFSLVEYEQDDFV